MVHHDNRYSHFVAWLKVLLPVIALFLLSTMFLISRSIDPSRALTYADVNVEELAREQRITGPRFSGVTSDGVAVSFSAGSAQPDPENPALYTVTSLHAQIATPDGGVVNILTELAVVNGDKNELVLRNGVSLTTSTDYSIETDGLFMAMDTAWIESIGPVSVDGPIGHFSAGQMHMTRQGNELGTYLLVFKDGVKMVYTPNSNKDE